MPSSEPHDCRRWAVWETAALAALLALGLDADTAARVGDRIRALAPVAGAASDGR